MSHRAVIDVGTNSVKLLVATVEGDDVTPILETSEQTRLGQGFYQDHRLQPGPIAATAACVAQYVRQARSLGAGAIRIIATSAAREAVNQAELTLAIREASGLETEVIPGELEAEWSFAGVTSNRALARRRLLIMDVGGGSTEFILGESGHAVFSRSFPLGSVRLLERFHPSEAPSRSELESVRQWLRDFLMTEVKPDLERAMGGFGRPEMAVGVGGTTSILAMVVAGSRQFERGAIEATLFKADTLRSLHERLWSLPLPARRELPGLPPERADVILFGAAIYEAVLEVFQLPLLGVSTRGLRFAALLDRRGAA